ncbi:MAG TPA: DUF4129 domain-containing protein [Longimicrobiaceae bacterium]|nr:DUF4129 domain-containing protein [Longimicrobiaceae bacterium]
MQAPSLPSAAEVQQAVQQVFSRPEFAPADEAWSPLALIAALVGSFLHWLAGQFGRLAALESTSPVLFWLIVGWLALSALAIIAHLVVTAVQAGRTERKAAEAASDTRRAGPRTAAYWEEAARRAAAEGRWRDAALALNQALLLRLDARGAVRFDPAKTPGDYRREARAHPQAAGALGAFLRGFEPVAFGGRPLDAAGYEQLAGAARQGGAGG